MSFPIYTTPTFTLTFTEQGLDLTQAANVYVTFKSGGVFITKTGEQITVEAKSITVELGQEETAGFANIVSIQANWTTPSGKRLASEIVDYNVYNNLLMRVVE